MNSASAVTDYLEFKDVSALAELVDSAIKTTDFDYTPRFDGKINEIRCMTYSQPSALLELTDNPLPKGATSIKTYCHRSTETGNTKMLDALSVLDNASGMTYSALQEAWVFHTVKEGRCSEDIGKFHVGMKYAAIYMANDITIVSKVKGGGFVGLYANVKKMRSLKKWDPTETNTNVNHKWLISKIAVPALVEEFMAQDSGTLIHITDLVPMCVRESAKILAEFSSSLRLSYSMLPRECKLSLYDNLALKEEIRLFDLFYRNNRAALDEDPYETTLYVYRGSAGKPDEVYEVCKVRRSKTRADKTFIRPGIYRHIACEEGERTKSGSMKSNVADDRIMVAVTALPKETDSIQLLGKADIRIIQTTLVTHRDESKKIKERELIINLDRKGFWFNRGIRTVATAKNLGQTFNDRNYSGCNERQRTLVTFDSTLDEQFGSQFNKKIEDKPLPCVALQSALWLIYRQVTKPWTKAADEKKKEELAQRKTVESDDSDEESDDESDNESVDNSSEEESDAESSSDEESDNDTPPPKKSTPAPPSNAVIVPKPQPIVPVPSPDKPKPFSMEDLKKDEESDEEDEEEPPAKPAPPPQPTQSVALKGQTIQLLNGGSLTSEITGLPHADKFFNWIQLVNCGAPISESQRSQIHAVLAHLVK